MTNTLPKKTRFR